MPIAPMRDLGSIGVVTDTDPFDLPPQAFTMAVNARFEDKKITRGPVFSGIYELSTNLYPTGSIAYVSNENTSYVYLCNRDGSINAYNSGVETTMSPSTFSANDSNEQFTSTLMNDLVYVNRSDRVPWYIQRGGIQFSEVDQTVGVGWQSDWRCKSIRNLQGQVIAIGMTEGGNDFGQRVRWSDFTLYDTPTSQWVPTAENSAGNTDLTDIQEPLLDGLALRNYMVLYSGTETWGMYPNGTDLVYTFQRLFWNHGIIGTNCVVEVDAKHYVFGDYDIWMHDGFQPVTIAAGRVRDFIYNNLDRTQTNQFFVTHNRKLNEIVFCYVSNDPFCQFKIGSLQGCNRAAVYNYRANTWYFYDLPYVTSMNFTTPVLGKHWSQETDTWSGFVGSWSANGEFGRLQLFVTTVAGPTYAVPQIMAFEKPASTNVSGTSVPLANAPVFLENKYMNLDDLQVQLRGYKVVKSIYPEARLDPDSSPIYFAFGSVDYPNSPYAIESTPIEFDGDMLYKLDYMTSGRYISMEVTYDDVLNFTLSGMDFDYDVTGSR